MSTVIAKDTKNKMVLVTGVGFARSGTMWYSDDDDYFKKKEGYDSAPERDSTGEFGSPTFDPMKMFKSNLPS